LWSLLLRVRIPSATPSSFFFNEQRLFPAFAFSFRSLIRCNVYSLVELDEMANVLQLILNSDAIISAGETTDKCRELRSVFNILSPKIIDHSREAHEIYAANHWEITKSGCD
jgi:hypothetical protein